MTYEQNLLLISQEQNRWLTTETNPNNWMRYMETYIGENSDGWNAKPGDVTAMYYHRHYEVYKSQKESME